MPGSGRCREVALPGPTHQLCAAGRDGGSAGRASGEEGEEESRHDRQGPHRVANKRSA